MRRLSTLTVLAIFSPIMCVIALVTFIVMEIAAKRRQGAKYRSGLPRVVERSMAEHQDAAIAYMIAENITPTEYARRARERTQG